MKLFHFFLSHHWQIPKGEVETEKNTAAFYCRLHFYIEPAALINSRELSEGKVLQPLRVLPHYVFIVFCLLLSVSPNMTYGQAYSRSGDDIF